MIIEDKWGVREDGASGWLVCWYGYSGGLPEGAAVTFRYTVDPEQRAAAATSAQSYADGLRSDGAASVEIVEVVSDAGRA